MSLQGRLLVAHPRLRDGVFHRSVVLVTEDHAHGSVGLVLNKPSDFSIQQIMTSKGLDCDRDGMVYRGGPVNPSALILIHSDDWFSSNTMGISPGLAISSDNFMMEKIAMGNYPSRWRFIAGVSGWQPGQLRDEIEGEGAWRSRGSSWLVADCDPEFVTRYDGEKQWHKALEICSQTWQDTYF